MRTTLVLDALYGNADHDPDAAEWLEQFQAFLVQTLLAADEGDVGEAMVSSLVIQSTPRLVLLHAVVPELGPDGQLEGALAPLLHGGNYLTRYLQLQFTSGHQGEPNFRYFGEFLSRYTEGAGRDVLICHMFDSDPAQALRVMTSVSYFGEFPLPGRRMPEGALHLLQTAHVINDIEGRMARELPVEEVRIREATQFLEQAAQHEHWWVRLFAATVLTDDQLGTLWDGAAVDQMRQQLREDPNQNVRQRFSDDEAFRHAETKPQEEA